ncbi:TPA: type IV secretion protein Rhs [Salmonella enterica]|nr:type IV secretion protein Rhs [Salmonella enterica]
MAQVLGRGEKTRVRWFRNGLNGSPEALTDSDGVVKWRQQWPARLWGRERHEVLKDAHGVMQNLRFQGQYLDRETGLHYNLFRYYDPDCGRFTQPDPIGLMGGINLYAYAPNPLSWIDPLGLAKCHFSGNRGRNKAAHDIERNGYRIVAEEVTMKVNGSRIRADFVAIDGHGNYHVFEAKHGNSGLTRNQGKAGVFDMNSLSNTTSGIGGGTITPSAGTKGKFEVATGNKEIGERIGERGSSHDATFHVLTY